MVYVIGIAMIVGLAMAAAGGGGGSSSSSSSGNGGSSGSRTSVDITW